VRKMHKNDIVKYVVRPLLRRGGTALATMLVAYGIPQEIVSHAVALVTAVGLVAVDLVLSGLAKREELT
jgi:hypothetical protein